MWEAITTALGLARDLIRAGESEERQRQALLAAEERLAKARAKKKFGVR